MAHYCTLCNQPIKERKLKRNKGLPVGVMTMVGRTGKKTYRAQIWHDGTNHGLGTYRTVKEAQDAYMRARSRIAMGEKV